MSEKEFTPSFGAIESPIDVRDFKLSSAACATEFPESFELAMCGIKNQGAVGSCVAHSLAETIEYHDLTQNKTGNRMSTGFIYGNRRTSSYKGAGMVVRDALKAITEYGDCYWTDMPANVEVPSAIEKFEGIYDSVKDLAYPNRISEYFRVSSISQIKAALMNHGPVVFVITWYSDIKVDSNGVMSSKCEKNTASGAHCMVIYGWDSRGWKIQNSWGIGWGKKGTAILPYDFPINEAWGIVDNIVGNDQDLKKPFNTIIGQVIAKVINCIINLFKKK